MITTNGIDVMPILTMVNEMKGRSTSSLMGITQSSSKKYNLYNYLNDLKTKIESIQYKIVFMSDNILTDNNRLTLKTLSRYNYSINDGGGGGDADSEGDVVRPNGSNNSNYPLQGILGRGPLNINEGYGTLYENNENIVGYFKMNMSNYFDTYNDPLFDSSVNIYEFSPDGLTDEQIVNLINLINVVGEGEGEGEGEGDESVTLDTLISQIKKHSGELNRCIYIDASNNPHFCSGSYENYKLISLISGSTVVTPVYQNLDIRRFNSMLCRLYNYGNYDNPDLSLTIYNCASNTALWSITRDQNMNYVVGNSESSVDYSVDYSVNLDPSFTQFISPQNSIPSQLPAITNIPDISNLPVTPITNSFFAYEAVDNTCLYNGDGTQIK